MEWRAWNLIEYNQVREGTEMYSTMKRPLCLCALGAFLCMPAIAFGQVPWSDDFDSYANDSALHGQGGWKGWDNDP